MNKISSNNNNEIRKRKSVTYHGTNIIQPSQEQTQTNTSKDGIITNNRHNQQSTLSQSQIMNMLKSFPQYVYIYYDHLQKFVKYGMITRSGKRVDSNNSRVFYPIPMHQLDSEYLYVWDTNCEIWVSVNKFDEFLNQIGISNPQQLRKNYASDIVNDFKKYQDLGHLSGLEEEKKYRDDSGHLSGLEEEIGNIKKFEGLWICFIVQCSKDLMYDKQFSSISKYIIYGNYLEQYHQLIKTNNDFIFYKLCLSSYLYLYDRTNNKNNRNDKSNNDETILYQHANHVRHCCDYDIATKYRNNVIKSIEKFRRKLPEHKIQNAYRKVGCKWRTVWVENFSQTPSEMLQKSHDDYLKKSQYSLFVEDGNAQSQMCAIYFYLLVILIEYNKEIMRNTSLKHAQFDKFNWQEIVAKTNAKLLDDLKNQSREFSQRLDDSNKYSIYDWCIFLNYWLKYDNGKYPNFFEKIALIMKTFPDILEKLFYIHDYICTYFKRVKHILDVCKQDEKFANIIAASPISPLDEFQKECELFEIYTNGFNENIKGFEHDFESVVQSVVYDKNLIVECVKHFSQSNNDDLMKNKYPPGFENYLFGPSFLKNYQIHLPHGKFVEGIWNILKTIEAWKDVSFHTTLKSQLQKFKDDKNMFAYVIREMIPTLIGDMEFIQPRNFKNIWEELKYYQHFERNLFDWCADYLPVQHEKEQKEKSQYNFIWTSLTINKKVIDFSFRVRWC